MFYGEISKHILMAQNANLYQATESLDLKKIALLFTAVKDQPARLELSDEQ